MYENVLTVYGKKYQYHNIKTMKLTDQFPAFNTLRKPVPNGLIPEGAGLPPYGGDLNTLHKTVNGNNWLEELAGLPGSILPRVAHFNGTDDFLSFVQKGFGVASYCFKFNKNVSAIVTLLGRTSASANYIYIHSNNKLAFETSAGGVLNQFDYIFSNNIKYDVILTADSSNNFSLYVNKVFQQTINVVASKALLLSFVGYRAVNPFSGNISELAVYERVLNQSEIDAWSNNISIDKTNLYFKFILTGQGNKEYDLSDNGRHLTWSGSGSRHDYVIEGSLYPLQNGLSMYSNIAKELIRVPYDINGLPLVAPPVPAGYTLRSEHPASIGNLNMFDCKIDFDPTESGDSKLENFNRFNATIFNDDARAGADYDSNHPYQFQIDNLDPRILFTWRNVGHKGMLYAKIYMDVNKNIIRILEMLNYLSDHVDAEEYQIMIYCGYESIIIVDEFGDYLIDGDDYVLIEGL